VQISYQDQGTYQAGACNIGPAEIARRRRAGLFGVGLALGIAVVLVAIDAPAWARFAVFPFLAGGLVSLEQVRRRFCVGFALAGIRNFGPLGGATAVTSATDRATDRRTALVMVATMSAIAFGLTMLLVLAPI